MARNHTTAPSRRTRITLSLPELRIVLDALSQAVEKWEDIGCRENDPCTFRNLSEMVQAADKVRNRLLEARDRMD